MSVSPSLYMFSGLQSQQPLTQPTPCLSTYAEFADESLATIPFAYKRSKIATNRKQLHTSKFYLYKCALATLAINNSESRSMYSEHEYKNETHFQ